MPEDRCFTESGDGKSYAAYLDVTALTCAGNGQPDDRDTLLITTQSGFSANTAACLSEAPYVWGQPVGGSQVLARGTFQPALSPLIHSEMRAGILAPGGGKIEPPSVAPLGYCLIYEGEQLEYVLYSFCDQVTLPEVALMDPALPSQWTPEALRCMRNLPKRRACVARLKPCCAKPKPWVST